ncbi:ABC transporter permease [Sciscionella sediminilitoris]|uniref:ABC transporter permease n=1 Tax=Sciscionella sediminilitoris TaxID=1445613 RepID=UPI0004DF397B|nr:ABC transporter permease [Sciscionella sp. SE31]
MGRYIIRRLLQLIPVFFGTTLLIYVLVWLVPGDPFAGKCGDRACPPAYIEQMTHKYNLDQNIFVQYFLYLGKLFQGDFGQTYSGVDISTLIGQAYPITLRLAIIALIFEGVIGLAAGIITGLGRKRFVDNLVMISTLVLISLPVFVTGFIIQVVFGMDLGWMSVTVSSDAPWGELIAPGFVLASLSMAYVARLTRTSIKENKRADYVRTAIAKGQPQKRVIGIHLLRNSAIPVMTFLGQDLGALMGGAIVTEGVFNIKGIGGLVKQGIETKESMQVVGLVTILVLVFLVMNLIVDLLYAVLDPRIRYD